jgi:hypothetical protein
MRDVAPHITADQLEHLIGVIGGVEEHGAVTAPARSVLARLAVDPTTRAYGSKVPLVRDLANKLHDNHLPQDIPVRSLDISTRVEQNRIQGRAKLILDTGYDALIADRNNFTLSREEFNRMVGSTLVRDGKLPAGHDPQFARHIEETARRYIAEVRDPVQDSYVALKKLQLGPKLVDESERAVERARARVNEIGEKREKMGIRAVDSNAKSKREADLRAARKSGIYRSGKEVERLRSGALVALDRRYDALRSAVNKHAFDRLSNLDGDLLAGIDMSAGSLEDINGRLFARIDALERSERARVNSEYDAMAERMEKYRGDIHARARGNMGKQALAVEDEYGRAVEQLAAEEQLLAERRSGSFHSDIPNWLQDNDAGYTHRMYDYGKILPRREEFIGDVSGKLVALEGLGETEAGMVARALYEELLTKPVGRKYINRVHLRGAEQGRTFQFSSDVVADWLDTDAQRMAERWADTVIADYIVQRDVGTFDASTFQGEIRDQIFKLIERGDVLASDADHILHSSVGQIQTMIDSVRGLNYPPGGALWSRRSWQVSAATRSLQSIVSLGGLVYTSLFDVGSTILNKGVFRTL